MKLRYLLLNVAFLIIVFIAGCVTATSTPISTATGGTFGQLAQDGQPLYAASCGECHGINGQGNDGPPVWGEGAQLKKYDTAQGLLNYIAATMPMGDPGSLEHQTYADILCYILIQNSYVSSGTAFSESQLASISLG